MSISVVTIAANTLAPQIVPSPDIGVLVDSRAYVKKKHVSECHIARYIHIYINK